MRALDNKVNRQAMAGCERWQCERVNVYILYECKCEYIHIL